MHKRSVTRRMVSALLCTALLMSAVPTAALAQDGDTAPAVTLAEGATIAGTPQTTVLAADGLTGRETDLDAGWKFFLGNNDSAQNPNFDDSGWESVDLPHDFSISQNFTTSGEAESGFLPGGTGWYRRTLTLPESYAGKTLLLNFDGVYSQATVYVNGTQVGEHHYGYTAFAIDVSDALVCDGTTENVIAVKAVNNLPSSRWYSGSGIYRDVTLIAADPVHVQLNGTAVTTPDIAQGTGTAQTVVEVVNDSDTPRDVTVRCTVYNAEGTAVSDPDETVVPVEAGQTAEATCKPVVASPSLWSPDSPTLYTLRTELLVDGSIVDTVDSEFGYRWYAFDQNGFSLNGQPVKINGVCLHHDQGALGSAAYDDAIYRQLTIMKDMGVNAIRTSHNPADQDFISACNKIGLMVVEEAFDGWVDPKNSNSNDFSRYFDTPVGESCGLLGAEPDMTCAEYAIKSMVRRDRNAPCIILWSLGNEVQEGTYWENVGNYAAIAQNLIDWIHEEDTTRPTTSGDNNRGGDSRLVAVLQTILKNGGVVGFNYANSASQLKSLADQFGGCILASETSSATNSRGIYLSQANNSNADGKLHLTSYDTSAVSWGITAHESIYNTYQNDCVAGEFVWTGFDYIGEPTPWNGTTSGSTSGRGSVPNSSYFGIVETTGFEKDTYYLYRSQWNRSDTTLHLVTAWDPDNMVRTNGLTPVVIYSNAPVVKLYRNGELIGTATRNDWSSAAGHELTSYTTQSDNSSVCTAVQASGSEALYATFRVAYEEGAITARAFEADGVTEITDTKGRSTVATPGTVDHLAITANRTSVAADGSSLIYVTVDLQDANGVLDTTATNTIRFHLSGDGTIAGVDNGDQATNDKFQQASVLTGDSDAVIQAYAGKALVILRSTHNAGSMTLDISSDGLTGGQVTVQTTPTASTVTEGLVSYTMVRDYTIQCGTVPTLQTEATGTMADGSEVTGTVTWDEIPSETVNTPGDHVIGGTLQFAGEDPLSVTCRLHVIDNIQALRNVSAVTQPGVVPTLPDTVSGVLADGTLSSSFAVEWKDLTADRFAKVGDVVTVEGSAAIFGDNTLPVTATVRVAEAVSTESINVAPQASSLTQDIDPASQSDVLSSLNNGVTKPGDNTSERWSNWNNRSKSATATLTYTWATAQMVSGVNLYYYYDSCAAKPESVSFAWSLNGSEFTPVEAVETSVETYALGELCHYEFASPVNPVALQITLTQQGGTSGSHCVALTEAEVMTFAGKLEWNTGALLEDLAVNGQTVEGFAPETMQYTVQADGNAVVTAKGRDNAAVTVLPVLGNTVRVLTLSEDGSSANTYEVYLSGEGALCPHTSTHLENQKDATCTQAGYTGDKVCDRCGAVVETGTVIPATGHTETELRNAKEATCTEPGYSGDVYCKICGALIKQGEELPAKGHVEAAPTDAKEATCTEPGYTGTVYCAVCGEKIRDGITTPAKGHVYDEGKVTKQPTATETGIKTYTCTVCHETKEEIIPCLGGQAPTVSLKVEAAANGRIKMTGCFEDYANVDSYYNVTAHGLVYYSAAKLGTKMLSINTPGRTRVSFTKYGADGTFSYTMTPSAASTRYAVRAFLTYTDPDTGRSATVYSDTMYVSYNNLS